MLPDDVATAFGTNLKVAVEALQAVGLAMQLENGHMEMSLRVTTD